MRLFGKIDTAISRFDRAQWMSAPFDLAWSAAPAGVPEQTFAAPPRGTVFDPIWRGTIFDAPPRGTTFELMTRR